MKKFKQKFPKIILSILLAIALCVPTVFLTGCGGKGNGGGLFMSILQPPVQDQCTSSGSKKTSSTNINIGEDWTKPDGKEGTVVAVPDEYKTNCFKNEGWNTTYEEYWWKKSGLGHIAEPDLTQNKKWWAQGCPMDEKGICMINNRYCCAMKPKWGKVGDYVDIRLATGKVIPLIITDTKGNENQNEWCHGGPSDWNFVEFCFGWAEDSSNHPWNSDHEEWDSSDVIAICSYGAVEGDTGTTTSKKDKCALKQTEYDYLVKAQEFADDNSIGYLYGGNMHNGGARDKDVDCSHFVYEALYQCGYNVTYAASGGIPSAYASEFTQEAFDQSKLKKGDIVGGPNHVEFVLSSENGQVMTIGAHTDSDGKAGDSGGREVCAVNFHNTNYTYILHPINPHMIGVDEEEMTEKGRKIVAAAKEVPSPGGNLCAMWVSQVYQKAGYGYPGGNGNSMLDGKESSTDMSNISPGEVISAQYGTGSAGRQYGHVCIYMGNGMVRENIGRVVDTPLSTWLSTYGSGWIKHGWL